MLPGFAGREQEVSGVVMRAEKGLDLDAQSRVAGALRGQEMIARGSGGQFQRPVKEVFCSCREFVHRAGFWR